MRYKIILAFRPFLIILMLAGIHLLLALDVVAFESAEMNPLVPVDTSSPRATLAAVSEEIDSAVAAFRAGKHTKMREHNLRGVRCLDLSEIPPALAERQRFEALFQLSEVLDRIALPNPDLVPNATQSKAKEIRRWQLPHTEIVIAKVEEGSREGEFLFSPETIDRVDEFYALVKHLPKLRPGATSADVYQLYKAGYGGLMPAAFIQAIPDWAKFSFLGQGLWKWIALMLVIGFEAIACVLMFHMRPKDEKVKGLPPMLRRMLCPLMAIGSVLMLDFIAARALRITGLPTQLLEIGGRIVYVFAAAYILHLVISWLADVTVAKMNSRAASIDNQLVRLCFRLVFWVTLIFATAAMAEQIGLPVAAVAASLGVCGLAIALAAQGTIENLVAGLTIYGDRSVSVGEMCRVGNSSGTVEEIGLRSIRIRTLERTLVTIPNSDFAKLVQENFTRRDHILFQTVLGLRYETTEEQLRYVLGKLLELLYAHPKVMKDKLRVRFVGFGAYSLDIEIFAYIRTQDKPTFLAIREDLLLRMMAVIGEAGAGFAFPSQTNYLVPDTAIEENLVHSSEEQVRQWRKEGTLPFPELAAKTRQKIKDSLDYPPVGSEQAKTKK